MTEQMTGRCLCGAVTYRTEGLPLRASHCHCEQCRRSGGSVALTLAVFNADQVTFSGIAMKHVRPTDFATRSFCPECGSHVAFRFDERPEMVAVRSVHLTSPRKHRLSVITSHPRRSLGSIWTSICR
ncbi:MAG: GFA family protein [Alphaproteobacteria bacterium]|nr:GFA family protein [Alphaproteobacteria bacterium]